MLRPGQLGDGTANASGFFRRVFLELRMSKEFVEETHIVCSARAERLLPGVSDPLDPTPLASPCAADQRPAPERSFRPLNRVAPTRELWLRGALDYPNPGSNLAATPAEVNNNVPMTERRRSQLHWRGCGPAAVVREWRPSLIRRKRHVIKQHHVRLMVERYQDRVVWSTPKICMQEVHWFTWSSH